MTFALAPELTGEAISPDGAGPAREAIRQIRDLGFLSTEQDAQLHPLVRAFLLQKLAAEPDAQVLATEAVFSCLQREMGPCFRAGPGFDLAELVEPVLEAAYNSLIRSGHLGTLSAFATAVRTGNSFPPPAVDLVDAELALRNGATRLARDLARRRQNSFTDHRWHRRPARSSRRPPSAKEIFPQPLQRTSRHAHARARSRRSRRAIWLGNRLHPGRARRLELGNRSAFERRHNSPLDLVRFGTVDLVRKRFHEGFGEPPELEEVMHSLQHAEDPRARTSFRYMAAYCLAVRAEVPTRTRNRQRRQGGGGRIRP